MEVIEELKRSDYIDELEIFHETYRFFNYNGEPYQAKVISLTEEINNPIRIEGKLPEKSVKKMFIFIPSPLWVTPWNRQRA